MSQQPLPTPSFPTAQDLADLQGDVVLGFPKRSEDFLFFTIQDAKTFKNDLKHLIPLISTTAQIQQLRNEINDHKSKGNPGLLKAIGINIAFTFKGLQKLGITESLGDTDFEAGQLADAANLGDTGTTDANGFNPNWLPAFKSEIDGVILVAGDCSASVQEGLSNVEHVLGKSIQKVLKVEGNVRPGKEKGHEHFGFLDGVSLPAIPALTGKLPGQQPVDPGVIVVGQTGDPNLAARPSWAKNGSFLAYRQLNQLVPEFDKFLHDNPINVPGLPRDQGSELLGARLVGRWKSGAPVDLTPLKDDPALGADPQRNNNFDFSTAKDQTKCPFAAHIRKTNPRSDLPQAGVAPHQVMRQGIPFGPEVSHEEQHTSKTAPGINRGLAFVCYQSTINKGFSFLQKTWVNNLKFPPHRDSNGNPLQVGFDPIIGTNDSNAAGRMTLGTNPDSQNTNITLPVEFVFPKGGAYFFSPSISALQTKLSV